MRNPAHFTAASEALFQMVQKWCRNFSRLSTGRRCISMHRFTDDTIRERFESVMLDDRGVRNILKDESRRATALSAILRRLIWEFVFTRYLFVVLSTSPGLHTLNSGIWGFCGLGTCGFYGFDSG
jgi:hypothetical protein